MEHHICCLISKQELIGIYKTIYLFLENQNFHETCKTFKQECKTFGCHIPNLNGCVKILKRPTQIKQDNNKDDKSPNESYILESYFNENHLMSSNVTGDYQFSSGKEDTDNQEVPECKSCDSYIMSGDDSINNLPNYEESTNILFSSDARQQGDVKIQHLNGYVELKKSFANLKEEHKKLIAVTAELTNALQYNIMGQTRNYHTVLDQCRSIYPALFVNQPQEVDNNNLEDVNKVEQKNDLIISINTHSVNSDINDDIATVHVSPICLETADNPSEGSRCNTCRKYVEHIVEDLLTEATKSPRNENNLNVSSRTGNYQEFVDKNESCGSQTNSMVVEIFPLDYDKIKFELLDGKTNWKLGLLQALRWRISKNNINIGNKVLYEYIQNDLFNLHKYELNIPERYLKSTERPENNMEAFARLLNTFACFAQGRDYLISCKLFLDTLLQLKLLDNKNIYSSYTRDMLVATLQKLSLRKHVRNKMINFGMVDQLLEFLSRYHSKISEYCLEYSLALLMNLSLEIEARDKMADKAGLLINLLKKLLTGQNSYLPYVNGTLYCVLAHPEINNYARSEQFSEDILQKIEKINEEGLKEQLQVILKTRFFDDSDTYVIDNSDKDENTEGDLLESELDEIDMMLTNIPIGEELLQHYKLQNKEKEIEESKILARPVTPAVIKQKRYLTATLSPNPHYKGAEEKTSFPIETIKSPPPPTTSSTTKWSFKEEYNKNSNRLTKRKSVFDLDSQFSSNLHHSSLKNKNKLNYKHLSRRKTINVGTYYKNPLCYLEAPSKILREGDSRYSCSCYEAIKKDLTDTDFVFTSNRFGDFYLSKDSLFKDQEKLYPVCGKCGDKTCGCAFEPRPKILRTPPN